MKKKFSLSICSLCTLFLLTGSLYGADEESDSSKQEIQIIPAGTKRFSQEEDVAIKEERAKAQQDAESEGNSTSKKIKDLISVNVASTSKKSTGHHFHGLEKITHGAYYFTSHEDAIHTALSVSEYREKVKLNDGTIWNVSSYDRWKLIDWLVSDGIFILPNSSFFSIYDYVLVNQRTGDYVDVNLCELEVLSWDPTYYGNRHWVISIDYFGNFVTLEDGSVWDIAYADDSILQRWYVGDVVTIGINDGWDSGVRPNILIHFNTLRYVRADCLN